MLTSGWGDALSTSGDGATFAGGTWLKGALREPIGIYFSLNVTLEAYTASVESTVVTEGTVATVSDLYGPKIALTVGADGKARARTWNVFTPACGPRPSSPPKPSTTAPNTTRC